MIEEVLKNAILVTGLVIIMMLMLEYLNVTSQGRWGASLRKSRFGQILLGGLLGAIPGCMGGFATVSLYSHKMLSFGALIAMMIASCGDESFVMLAMFPGKAVLIFGLTLIIGIGVGALIDYVFPEKKVPATACEETFSVHDKDLHHHHEGEPCGSECPKRSWRNLKNASWQRIVLLVGIAAFIVALGFGLLEHEHAEGAAGHAHEHHLAILDEYWLNLLFALCSFFALWFTAVSDEHFVKEHLWNHVIKHHFLSIFLWTAGALLVIELGLHYLDLESWVKGNVAVMILLAALVGMIPESGPHLIFVTLFASGMIPFSVMTASCISQDGHASLPLLAETKKGFLKAKLVNALVAAVAGYALWICGL